MRKTNLLSATLALVNTFAYVHLATGDTHTWSGAAITPNWSTPANWAGNNPPYAGEPAPVSIVFPIGAARPFNYCNIAGLVVDQITFSGGGYKIFLASPGTPMTMKNPFMSINCFGPSNTLAVPLILGATNLTCAVAAGTDLHLSGALTGPGSLEKFGRGDLYLEGAEENTFAAPATVLGGTLHLDKSGGTFAFGGALVIGDTNGPAYAGQPFDSVVQLGADQPMSFSTSITVNPDGELKLYGHSLAVGSLTMIGNSEITDGYTGNGTLTLLGDVMSPYVGYFGYHPYIDCKVSLGGATRTFNIGDMLEINGPVSGGGGSAGITKTGYGGLGLDYLNSYTGPTVVNGGAVYVDGTLPNSPVTVHSTGYFSGDGTAATVTCQGGGLYPFAWSGGNLGTKDIVLDSDSTFGVTIENHQTASAPSFLTVTGAVVLGTCKFSGIFYTNASFNPVAGEQFMLIQNDGVEPINGTFAGLPEGAQLRFGGRQWQITYKGGTGNDVVLKLLSGQLPLSVDSVSRDPSYAERLLITGTGIPEVDTYELQTSTNLTTWAKSPHSVYNNNGKLSSYDYIDQSEPARFYRFFLP